MNKVRATERLAGDGSGARLHRPFLGGGWQLGCQLEEGQFLGFRLAQRGQRQLALIDCRRTTFLDTS